MGLQAGLVKKLEMIGELEINVLLFGFVFKLCQTCEEYAEYAEYAKYINQYTQYAQNEYKYARKHVN
jgi:hypothetical protein